MVEERPYVALFFSIFWVHLVCKRKREQDNWRLWSSNFVSLLINGYCYYNTRSHLWEMFFFHFLYMINSFSLCCLICSFLFFYFCANGCVFLIFRCPKNVLFILYSLPFSSNHERKTKTLLTHRTISPLTKRTQRLVYIMFKALCVSFWEVAVAVEERMG